MRGRRKKGSKLEPVLSMPEPQPVISIEPRDEFVNRYYKYNTGLLAEESPGLQVSYLSCEFGEKLTHCAIFILIFLYVTSTSIYHQIVIPDRTSTGILFHIFK